MIEKCGIVGSNGIIRGNLIGEQGYTRRIIPWVEHGGSERSTARFDRILLPIFNAFVERFGHSAIVQRHRDIARFTNA